MTPLYRAFTLLSIAVLSIADPDGLTNCGETSTVPGLIGENTTVSFPIAGTCKTVIANYADGTEESISVEPSDCGSTTSTGASQVYQIAFGSSSPRGLASILFNCNGGLQVFCQRYNITMGDAPSTQDKTDITVMCNETTTYPLLSSGGSLGGVIASTPTNTGQVLSTLLTAATPVLTPVLTPAPTPFQGPNGPAGSTLNAGSVSIPGSGQNQEQSSGNNSDEPSGTADTFPTNSNGASPQASAAGGSGAPGGDGMNTSSGAPSGESESTGNGSANTSGGRPSGGSTSTVGATPSGGSTNTVGATPSGGSASDSGGSTTPSTTAVGGQSAYFPINTPNNPYAASTPQPSCTCTC